MKYLTKKAKADRICGLCKRLIPAGSIYYGFHEAARSSHEAIHAGARPFRFRCEECATERVS